MSLKDKNLYYIGGVVRDELLGVTSFDLDLCYEGNALEFAQTLNIVKCNPDLGTVRVLYKNKEIDIASTRTESYPLAGHLPIIESIGCSLIEDLRRRDFTINAMAKNTSTEKFVDYFGGKKDIENKTLRVLHDKSFIEDPSRIIRGLKFSVRFCFELDEATKKLQDEYLDNINYDLSYHRLKKELKETFNLNKIEAYNKFVEQGIYKLLGEKQEIKSFDSSVCSLIEKFNPKHIWLVYLGQYNLSSFELTCEEQRIIEGFIKIKDNIPSNDIEVYNHFNNIPLESILIYASCIDKASAVNYLENLSGLKIFISGKDLQELGIKPSAIYKNIFKYIREEKIQNPLMSKSEELDLVKRRFL